MRLLSSRAAAAALLLATAAAAPRRGDAQSLRGSPESVDRMYQQAVSERLPFHETALDVRDAARDGDLVRLESGANVKLRRVNFPYVAPATRTFVERLGAQYRAACRARLEVTSAVRPATRQPANSVPESVHPTGMAVDLHKPSGKCLRWLRTTLLALEDEGVVEATEEFHPPHFHVAVFPTEYARYAAAHESDAPAPGAAERPATERAATRAVASTSTRAAARTAARPASRPAARPVARAVAVDNDEYRVRPGDTLWDIARAHKVTVARLRAANGLARPTIRPGQTLVIPGDRGTADGAGQ